MTDMATVESEAAIREVIQRWRRLPQLAAFAAKRHGFGDSNGGFGVTYPGDIDPGEPPIQEGHVEVYGFWGPPDGFEILVSESQYLAALAQMLSHAGHAAEAEQVRSLVGLR